MAKPIVASLSGKEYSFNLSKIDRTKIYGSKKRVALDSQGRFCTRAALSSDGAHLLLTGMTAQAYFKQDGHLVAKQEMVGITPDGKLVEQIPSTLGVAQNLEGPVNPSEVLSLEVESIYFLESIDPASELLDKLNSGEIYKLPINYSAGLDMETGYLMANDEGCFAVVGKPAQTQWIESATLFESVEATEDADDLDFESM